MYQCYPIYLCWCFSLFLVASYSLLSLFCCACCLLFIFRTISFMKIRVDFTAKTVKVWMIHLMNFIAKMRIFIAQVYVEIQ